VRISTTTLESYRLFMQPDQEWMSEADLLATIRGEFTPTPAIELGLSYGRILEDPDRYLVPGGYQCGLYSFGLDDVEPALALIDRRGVMEAKAVKRYGPCDVVAKVDHILGAHLTEFKTTGSSFNIDKYLESCQWRFYFDVFEALKLTYHIFLLDDHENGVASLRGIESFQVYPYPQLHADCADLVREFAVYVTAKGLDGLLRERQQTAEAA
jgi:hypothetical protein